MALFCAVIRRDSVSFLRFPFLSHVQVISCDVSLVCRLKYPYSCVFYSFRFLFIFVLLGLVSSVLFFFFFLCGAVISLPVYFLNVLF